MALVTALGIKHGFTFSAGLIDYWLNWGITMRPLWLIAIGLVYLVVYWALFRFMIRRFNIMTPGREPELEEAAAD